MFYRLHGFFSLYVLKNSFSPSLKGGIFLLVFWSFLTQSSRRFCEMMPFLSSQRNIVDILESTRIFNAKNVQKIKLVAEHRLKVCERSSRSLSFKNKRCLSLSKATCNKKCCARIQSKSEVIHFEIYFLIFEIFLEKEERKSKCWGIEKGNGRSIFIL